MSKFFRKIKVKGIMIIPIILCLLLVPLNLAINNWDDHDRSNRYTAYAMAVNYLESCDENAILFTIGIMIPFLFGMLKKSKELEQMLGCKYESS